METFQHNPGPTGGSLLERAGETIEPSDRPAVNASAERQKAAPGRPRWIDFAIFSILLVLVALSRLAHLGDKPFHHDESLFAYYAWNQALAGTYNAGGYSRNPETEESGEATDAEIEARKRRPTHHPLLHGPLQIELIGLVLRAANATGLIGNGDAAVRLLAALSGIGLFALVWFMRRDLGREGRLLALVAIACSPGIWYYSRFCRNEAPFMLATLAWVVALARAARAARAAGDAKRGAVWFALVPILSAALVAFKENSLFLLFDAATFLILLAVFRRRGSEIPSSVETRGVGEAPQDGRQGATLRLEALFWPRRYAWLGGLALGWLLLEVVYTNGFAWDTSFVSMYRDVLHYWAGQHSEHRLYGEFHYYLPILALYEPVVLLTLISASIALFIGRRKIAPAILLIVALAIGSGLGLADARAAEARRWLAALHMTQPWHLALAFGMGWTILYGAWSSLRARRRFRAWLIWWTGLSLLQYGYAGEKVPWISTHITLPAILLAALATGDAWRRLHERPGVLARLGLGALLALWLLGAGFNAVQGYRLCFVHPTNPGERLVYNHTQPPVAKIGHEMRQSAETRKDGRRPMLQGEACWPLLWYLHGCDYAYSDGVYIPDMTTISVLVCDIRFADENSTATEEFSLEECDLRQAWEPEPLRFFAAPSQALEDFYPDGVPPREKWDAADKARVEAHADLYGWRAVGTLARYVFDPERRPWGDPKETAIPQKIYIGRRQAAAE